MVEVVLGVGIVGEVGVVGVEANSYLGSPSRLDMKAQRLTVL